jgi:hypothetical protein
MRYEYIYQRVYDDVWYDIRTYLWIMGFGLFLLALLLIALWAWWLAYYFGERNGGGGGGGDPYNVEDELCNDTGQHVSFSCFNESLCEALDTQDTSFECLGDVNFTNLGGGDVINWNNETMMWENEICDPCRNGTNCWDLNDDGLCDLVLEDINGDGVCNTSDCGGPPCWDTNGNLVCDLPEEDINGDGNCNVADCTGFPCWDLNHNLVCDLPDEDVNGDGNCTTLDCAGPPCWDLNENLVCDLLEEDVNDDGVCNITDCTGPKGEDAVVEPCDIPFASMVWAEGNATEDTYLTIAVSASDTWYPISDANCQDLLWKNMTYVGNCSWMVDINGTYNIDASMGFTTSAGGAPEIALGISIDDAAPAITDYTSSDGTRKESVSFERMFDLTEGQTIGLSVLNVDNTEDVLVETLHLLIEGEQICVEALTTDLEVTTLQFPPSEGPPCDCNSGPECPPNLVFFCTDHGSFFYCDENSSSWLSVGMPISMEGEQNVGCVFGNNLTNDYGCSAAWGAGVGVDDNIPRNGLYVHSDLTIISWGISIDEQSECSSGSYDAMVCWTSGPTEDSDYHPSNCTVLESGLTQDAENDLGLRVEIPGHRYIAWGIHNGCNGGGTVTDWNMHLLIKYRI